MRPRLRVSRSPGHAFGEGAYFEYGSACLSLCLIRAYEHGIMVLKASQNLDAIAFGPFVADAGKRLLLRDGKPVNLGARAFDILITLLSQPNEAVSKRRLLAEVWPGVTVEEGALRFQVSKLRQALGDGIGGARYITTLSGQGYCFVGTITRPSLSEHRSVDRRDAGAIRIAPSNLPLRSSAIIGRSEDVARLHQQIASHRFVTIVGPGGIGKTTVAVELGHQLGGSFSNGVLFVDFGLLSEPHLVPIAVASMLGLSVQSDDPTPGLLAYLRSRHILLIFDTCEHLIDAVATLATRIFEAAPQVCVLATSREPLQIEGERIHRLTSLASPPDNVTTTVDIVRAYPATQLFVERAAASGAGLEFSDDDAAVIADICRRLGGVALAIELAARRVEAFGLRQIGLQLDQSLPLSWKGARSAPPRQRTLQDTLEWSYRLLADQERKVLRGLAIFVGDFTMEAALAVVTSDSLNEACVFEAVDSLVAKSMIAPRPTGGMMRYRLLDTTRAYALDISNPGERAALARSHADYYRLWLEQAPAAKGIILRRGLECAGHFAALNNVRAALDWSFGQEGDVAIGVDLVAAMAPVFLAMSLLSECHRWSERALAAMDSAAHGGPKEMHFQAALGVSVMFTRGGKETARVALTRSFELAEAGGDGFEALQVLGPLQMFYLRSGDFIAASHYAARCEEIADRLEDPVAMMIARCVLGMSLHFRGQYGAARAKLEAAVRDAPSAQRTTTVYIGFECRLLASAVLARTLWLQGYPALAMERARWTVKEAAEDDHSVTLCIALIWAISVALWVGDADTATEYADWLVSVAEAHSLAPYLAVGHTYCAILDRPIGAANEDGVERLKRGLGELAASSYAMLNTPFSLALVEAFRDAGRLDEGLELLEAILGQVQANGDAYFMPELLRVKSGLHLAASPSRLSDAEKCLVAALDVSRQQGAHSWALRAGIDLAHMLAGRGQQDAARSLLEPLCQQVIDGEDTLDVRAAREMLAGWS